MAIMREVPRCYKCGKPNAKAVYKEQSKDPMQVVYGDNFLYWKDIEHECDGESTNEKSVLNI